MEMHLHFFLKRADERGDRQEVGVQCKNIYDISQNTTL